MKKNNVLGLVMGTILVSGGVTVTTAYAGGYCTSSGCYVWETAPRWGSDGGGSGSYDNTTTYGPEDPQMICADLKENPAPNCNADNPPQLVVNGCGSATVDVPDFLVSFFKPLPAASYGGIFTEACNKHDVCYGSWGQPKSSCDADLKNDMIQAAKTVLGIGYPAFQVEVEGQAWAYSTGLAWGPIQAFISQPAFDSAQAEGQCRSYAGSVQYFCH